MPYRKNSLPRFLLFFCLAVSLMLVGCPDDNSGGDFEDASRGDLENRTFVFNDGSAFGINEQVTLRVGRFTDNAAPFRLETNPEATGTLNFDDDVLERSGCLFGIATSTFEGEGEPQEGDLITMRPCEIGEDGQLRLENDDTGLVSISNVPTGSTGTGGN